MKSLFNFKKLLVFLLLLFFSQNTFSNKCLTKQDLKIGFIENSYIDYEYYLYYALGEYSSNHDILFNINEVNENEDEFDIIFGEFRDLEKLGSNQIEVPDKVLNFYKKNEIEISRNIFPLDLDTFILLSQNEVQKLTFEELSEIYNPLKYTLGMSLLTKEDTINLLIYHMEETFIDTSSLSFELTMELFRKTYENINKNILNNNFLEVYSSFENSENVYTLFSDGILLNKNTDFDGFFLFPKSKYIWSQEKGIFEENLEANPLSFYGFSAYLNNSQSSGFLCYLINEEVRLKAFKDFNIQLSPLSLNEVENIKSELPLKYIDILNKKNKNIFTPNYSLELNSYDLFSEIFLNKKKLEIIFSKSGYLNYINK